MKVFFLTLTLLASNSAFAGLEYYPQGFAESAKSGSIKSADLKNRIFTILDSAHQKVAGGNDILSPKCASTDCYKQTLLGYDNARRKLFGDLDLKKDQRGHYFKDAYCNKEYDGNGIGPGLIPKNEILNCEHTWPQSRFSKSFPDNLQKGDLNHLYGVDSHANSIRSSNPFGEVANPQHPASDCEVSNFGKPVGGGGSDVFEPPQEHKGNVARSLFYFSVRYKMPIDARQEATLRQWHKDDPVDQADRERNEKVFKLQNNRNPFIDFPELVDSISDF